MGREEKYANDLFYTCSLIEYIARKTKNKNSDIVNILGKEKIKQIYSLADVYHSDNIDDVSDELISKANITVGNYDNISNTKYNVPSYFDIGKVYKRLIIGIAKAKNIDLIDALMEAYNSFVSNKIEDYNSSFYYDNPQNILNSYLYNIIE